MNDKVCMSKVNEIPVRGNELFRVFARFEFALKDAGYFKTGSKNAVEADWDSFANKCLGVDFYNQLKVSGDFSIIFDVPLGKQIVNEDGVGWDKAKLPADVQSLFGAVRRVRNNLFHGGKSDQPDSDRNDELVDCAISIMICALRKCESVRWSFEGRY